MNCSCIFLGCVGGVCAFANILPGPLCDIHKLCAEGQWEEAKAVHLQLIKSVEVNTHLVYHKY